MLARAEQFSLADAVLAPAVAPIAVAVSGLCKSFERGKPVLSDVDLAVSEREAVGIIGANGSGKSTMLRCLVGLCQADSGAVRIFGEDIGRPDRKGLRRLRGRVGFVFQRHNLVGRLSALSNVVHGVQARERGPTTWSSRWQDRAREPKPWRVLRRSDCAMSPCKRLSISPAASRSASRSRGS